MSYTFRTENIGGIDYAWRIIPEHMPIRGNAMASGDDAADREAEDWIISELDSGNDFAWCIIECRASYPDLPDLYGSDSLGGCSYRSEVEFMEPGGYADDMRASAYADLVAATSRIRSALANIK